MAQTLDQLKVPAQYLEVFGAFLNERGRRLEDYLATCGLDPHLLKEPGGTMSGEQMCAVMRVCQRFADPALPLSVQLLSHFPVTAHGTLGIVVMTSPNLEAALEAALHFYPLVMPAFEIRREDLGDQVHLVARPLYDLGDVADDLMETLLGAFNSIRRYVNPGIRLLEIHLRHPRRFPAEAYAAFADPDAIFFDQPCDKIVIPKRHLRYPLSTSNRATMEQFRSQLEQQAARLTDNRPFSHQVREALVKALRQHRQLQVHEMAESFNLSQRTLGRRLSAEGSSFKQLAYEARIDYAEFLLLNSQRPISQIAHAAGFTNDSSFSRAFRKLRGCSPRELRQGDRQ